MADKEIQGTDNTEIASEIRLANRTSLFQRLAARFGFVARISDGKTNGYKLIQKPTENQLKQKSPKEELELITKIVGNSHMSSSVQDLMDEWMNDTQSTYANIGERQDRLNAFTHLCDNEPYVESAVELTANEVASLSNNTQAFTVISEDQKWQDSHNKLLKDVWGYDTNRIFSLAWDIFLYGEAFEGNEVNNGGIVKVNGLRPNVVVERLDFNPSETADFCAQAKAGSSNSSTGFSFALSSPTMGSFSNTNLNFNWNKNVQTYESKSTLLKKYLDNLEDTSSNEFFTSHLLGYRMANDQMVAPWQITHYRYHAETSEFKPYGQPPLIAALAAYKQLQRALGLDDLRKMLSFPITQFKVKTGGATTARAFDIVNTVKEEFENVGLISYAAGMEGPSLCTNIWTSDDLVVIDKAVGGNEGEGGSTEEKNFFQGRVSVATGIPRSYLDSTAEGFQMSGVALATLFAPYRHKIEYIRNIICDEIEDKIRLHDSITNTETPPFVLVLNVNNPVATEDTNAKLSLANQILETIASLLGVEKEGVPQNVKKDILSKYGGFSKEELDKYLQILDQEGEDVEALEVSEENLDASFGDMEPSGGGMEGPGMESMGTPDMGDMGGDEGVEEAYIRRKKNRLVEMRYKALLQEDVLYYLTEKAGSIKTPQGYCKFSKKFNSPVNEEYGKFLRKTHTMKKGKSKING